MRTINGRVTALLLAVLTIAATVGCAKAPAVTVPGKIVMRYGPFTVPAARPGVMGMLENQIALNVDRPCSECYLTAMQAGLVTTDGMTANVDRGLWLHHMVLVNSGARDSTCPGTGSGIAGERFFSSGNERTPTTALSNTGTYGYPVHHDSWTLVYDLMNMTAVAAPVYVTVTFDYVPIKTPGYKPYKPLWLDVNPCYNPNMPAGTGKYSYTSSWTVDQPSKLLGIGGHLHDSGVDLLVTQNGTPLCDSRASYGAPGYVEGPASIDMPGMPHLSRMSTCTGTAEAPLAELHAGDQLAITANYDTDLYTPMGDEPVMGIAFAFVDPS